MKNSINLIFPVEVWHSSLIFSVRNFEGETRNNFPRVRGIKRKIICLPDLSTFSPNHLTNIAQINSRVTSAHYVYLKTRQRYEFFSSWILESSVLPQDSVTIDISIVCYVTMGRVFICHTSCRNQLIFLYLWWKVCFPPNNFPLVQSLVKIVFDDTNLPRKSVSWYLKT